MMHRMERSKIAEAGVILALTGLCLFWGFRAKVFEVNPGWDMISYIHMAESPRGFTEVVSHHGQRVFGPWLAGVLHWMSGISLENSFRFFAILSFAILPLLVIRILRAGGVTLVNAAVICIMILGADWPIRYGLGNIYQLTDSLVYPLSILLILVSRQKSVWFFFFSAVIAVLSRQNLLILAVGLFAERIWRNRRFSELILFAVVFSIFSLVALTAGSSLPNEVHRDGFVMIYKHSLGLIFHPAFQPNVFINIKNAVMMTPAWAPLLPLAVGCLFPAVWKAAIRHPSATLFAAITFVQPMIAFDMTGPDNARRLMMQGGFIFMIAGGWAIASRLQESPKALSWAFRVIPLIIILFYLISKPLALSDTTRVILGGYLLILMLLSFIWKVPAHGESKGVA